MIFVTSGVDHLSYQELKVTLLGGSIRINTDNVPCPFAELEIAADTRIRGRHIPQEGLDQIGHHLVPSGNRDYVDNLYSLVKYGRLRDVLLFGGPATLTIHETEERLAPFEPFFILKQTPSPNYEPNLQLVYPRPTLFSRWLLFRR